jgi:hypothetical protein
MTKLLSALVAATFAVASLTPVAFAAEKKGDALADACKDKKAGDEVMVDGKKMKCPAAKK